jgi:1-aminocyclopropane-1-carboxylate deaminase
MNINNIYIQDISTICNNILNINILRADVLDSVVSGNKWFKLQFYVKNAVAAGKTTLATFGGPYSNHIVATAKYGANMGLKTVGFIRGEAGNSPTLIEAASMGMKLYYISRESYQKKSEIINQHAKENWYWIQEGGYGIQGALGAATMLSVRDCSAFTHIVCACGTGTMMAGIVAGSTSIQKVIGISVLKNNYGIEESVKKIIPLGTTKHFEIFHNYHFGGYAKHPPALIDYMNNLFKSNSRFAALADETEDKKKDNNSKKKDNDNKQKNNNLDNRLKPNNIGQQLNLNAQEVNAVEAFLKTLSGSDVFTNKKWSNPFP